MVVVVRDCAGRFHVLRLAANFLNRDGAAAEPRRGGACLAAGVRELDADFLALRMREFDDTLQAPFPFDVCVVPDPGVLGRDAPFR